MDYMPRTVTPDQIEQAKATLNRVYDKYEFDHAVSYLVDDYCRPEVHGGDLRHMSYHDAFVQISTLWDALKDREEPFADDVSEAASVLLSAQWAQDIDVLKSASQHSMSEEVKLLLNEFVRPLCDDARVTGRRWLLSVHDADRLFRELVLTDKWPVEKAGPVWQAAAHLCSCVGGGEPYWTAETTK